MQGDGGFISVLTDGGGGYGSAEGSGTGGYTPSVSSTSASSQVSAPIVSSQPFDLSQSSVQGAVAKGNSAADILSAHQTYLSGVPVGRGGQYAVDAQKRFGYSSIRDAAAAYLDAAGLRRLAESLALFPVIDPEPAPDDSGVITQPEPIGEGDPFATLGDLVKVFEKVFSAPGATDTPAPVVVVGDATQQQKGAGGNVGLIIAVLAIAAGAVYWFYLRKKGASNAQ
jgi:hypothetical protein